MQEYAALLASLRALPSSAWSAPTDCTGWTVRDIVAHVVGAAEESARPWVQARHYLPALVRDRTRLLVDKVNDAQLADRRTAAPEELMAELESLAPKAARGRQRLPWLLRRMPLPTSQGGLSGDTMGYLCDVIYTRDIWMHRVDISRATDTPMAESTAEPEVVAQVVRDVARAWTGEPFTLELTGRVVGAWHIGSGGIDGRSVQFDAVDLCRALSGRTAPAAPPTTGATARGLRDRLLALRILF
jgi:uncharacterized protein (TIGR03083 family)